MYESKSVVAKLLNVQYISVTTHLDKWIKGGIDGNYLFSHELDNSGLDKLKEVSSLRRYNNCKVWVYNATTLELDANPFSSMQKAAEYLKVDYRSILNHLDTKIATIKIDKSVLLFSYELTQKDKESLLLNNTQKATNVTMAIWVYKNIDGAKLTLINNNKPTFSSRLEASASLNMSTKTINKYLDSRKEYKGLYFYSTPI